MIFLYHTDTLLFAVLLSSSVFSTFEVFEPFGSGFTLTGRWFFAAGFLVFQDFLVFAGVHSWVVSRSTIGFSVDLAWTVGFLRAGVFSIVQCLSLSTRSHPATAVRLLGNGNEIGRPRWRATGSLAKPSSRCLIRNYSKVAAIASAVSCSP